MTPDKMAFIQGAKPTEPPTLTAPPTPPTATPEADDDAPESKDAAATARPIETAETSPRRPRGRVRIERHVHQDSMPLGTAHLMAPITTRLQPATAAALKRAGLEQRLRGAQPATVQEIVEIAVAEWLQQHDYL